MTDRVDLAALRAMVDEHLQAHCEWFTADEVDRPALEQTRKRTWRKVAEAAVNALPALLDELDGVNAVVGIERKEGEDMATWLLRWANTSCDASVAADRDRLRTLGDAMADAVESGTPPDDHGWCEKCAQFTKWQWKHELNVCSSCDTGEDEDDVNRNYWRLVELLRPALDAWRDATNQTGNGPREENRE